VPSLIFKGIDLASSQSLVSAFSATGLLIIVSVALDFEKRLDAQLMMRTYKGFLK
jgi:preprotein translocase subunit SecY